MSIIENGTAAAIVRNRIEDKTKYGRSEERGC